MLMLALSPFEGLTRGWLLAGSGAARAAVAVLVWAWRGRPAAPPFRPAIARGRRDAARPRRGDPGCGRRRRARLLRRARDRHASERLRHALVPPLPRRLLAPGARRRLCGAGERLAAGRLHARRRARLLVGDDAFRGRALRRRSSSWSRCWRRCWRWRGSHARSASTGAPQRSVPCSSRRCRSSCFRLRPRSTTSRSRRFSSSSSTSCSGASGCTSRSARWRWRWPWPRRRRPCWRCRYSRSSPSVSPRAGAGPDVAVAGAAGIALGAFWYLRQPRGDRELHSPLRADERGRRGVSHDTRLRQVSGAAQPARDRRHRPGRLRGAGPLALPRRSC